MVPESTTGAAPWAIVGAGTGTKIDEGLITCGESAGIDLGELLLSAVGLQAETSTNSRTTTRSRTFLTALLMIHLSCIKYAHLTS
jgi:hypothetical protein